MPGSSESRTKSIELADAAMLTVAVLWASNNVITKAALDRGLEPLLYIVLRFALVAVLLFPYLWARGVSLRIRRADIPRFVGGGLCGFALYNLLYVVGLSHTSAFSAAILVSLAPIFMLLLSAVFGLEPVQRLQWIGVAVSFLGVAIFIGDKLLAGEPATGDLLNVIAALSFSIYSLTTRPLVLRYGPETTTAWAVVVGLVAVLPFTASTLRQEQWGDVTGFEWFSIAWAAIVSVMIGYSLWGWAIARAGAGRSVPYLFLIPVFTGVFSVIFRGERLGAAQVIGGAVALTGVAIARRFARPSDRIGRGSETIGRSSRSGTEAGSRARTIGGKDLDAVRVDRQTGNQGQAL
ncbi:MAG: DMT family transporter [Thermomicrobiales bacterium]